MTERSSAPDTEAQLKRALAAIKGLRARVKEADDREREPIAIVGMGCRFPGQTSTPDQFWELLCERRDAITEIPPERWDLDAVYDPVPGTPGKMYARGAGLVDDVEEFAADFFRISPREAVMMDPQQRMLLEVSWEVLERAGYTRDLVGSNTSAFVGVTMSDHGQWVLNKSFDLKNMDTYYAIGNTNHALAGRLAFHLGIHGPTLSLDTACSSSLVAVHLACESLRSRECDLALAAATNMILSPHAHVCLSQSEVLAPDSRCKTFDAAADGYARAEGVGVVGLRRLSDALASGDTIHALILGSAVNADGSSSGFTAPNGPAQQALLRCAWEQAGVAPEEIDYLEAHGTGTSLGDPIEIGAVGALMRDRPKDDPLIVGSVKTNIGHLEAAAGMAGLIKATLALEHESIPAHLHFKEPSPHISWDDLPITVPTEAVPWKRGEKRRIAAVNAFGLAGTNSHVVIAEAPERPRSGTDNGRPIHVLTLTAKTESALRRAATELGRHLSEHPEEPLPDVCYTLNIGRAHFRHRVAIPAANSAEATEKLVGFGNGTGAKIAVGAAGHGVRPKVAMLFSGQGSQYVGMGRDLYAAEPAFRAALDQCDEILRPLLEQSLLTVLFDETALFDEVDDSAAAALHSTAYTQPALFATEYALATMWRSWGIDPSFVVGHSVGEYAAACIAGIFSLEDGLKLIAERGRLMQALPLDGAMAAVFADEARVAKALEGRAQDLSIAAVNGPESVVISGRRAALEEVVGGLTDQGIGTKTLQVSHAFHSPLMEPMLDEFERFARTVQYSAPRIPLISNLTGEVVDSEGVFDASYWRRHVRHPVRFADSIATLFARDQETFLEIGPGSTLIGMGFRCDPDGERTWLPSLRSGQEDWRQALATLAELYVRGSEIDWSRFHQAGDRRRVTLPTYPFERRRYWTQDERDGAAADTTVGSPVHGGNIDELTRRLEDSGRFSDAELALLPKVLAAVAEAGERDAADAAVDDWLYALDWALAAEETATGPSDAAAKPTRWLIFADRGGTGRALAAALNEVGQPATLVFSGDGYGHRNDGSFVIAPEDEADFARLLSETFGVEKTEPWGIVHLWSLDATHDDASLADLVENHRFVCGSVIQIGRSLVGHGAATAPRLWMVTRGGQAVVKNDDIDLVKAPLWGLGRVLASENPPYWGGLIDLEPTVEPAVAAAQVAASLTEESREDQVAYRGTDRYVARLARVAAGGAADGAADLKIAADRTYLVTGGFGGLGLSLARWLAERGAKNLVLVGRNGAASEAARTAMSELEAADIRVLEGKVDISSADDTAALLAEARGSMPQLGGILHCAGVLDDGILTQQTWKRFERVMAPKVAGAWNLHSLTADFELEFFVLFSSASSLFGAPGQSNYAAANAFLDALAHYRRRLGQPAIAINWGPWAESGMAVDQQVEARLQTRGTTAFRTNEGIAALERALTANLPQVAAVRIDWDTIIDRVERGLDPSSPPFVSHFVEREMPTEKADPDALVGIREELDRARPDERPTILSGYITQHASDVFGRDRSEIPPDEPLLHLGLDSLMAVQLRNAFTKDLDVSIPVATFLEGASVLSLVQHALAELAASFGSALDDSTPSDDAIEIGPESAGELLDKVDELSSNEVDALLGTLNRGEA